VFKNSLGYPTGGHLVTTASRSWLAQDSWPSGSAT